jgi:hypothetical protein
MESGLPDGDLVRLAQSGDAAAFRLLVERVGADNSVTAVDLA